jgi:hypothetical protein
LHPRQRWRDLATIAATLPPGFDAPGDFLPCVSAYLACAPNAVMTLERASDVVHREARRLRRQRHVRTKARALPVAERLSLVCLEGEALRVSPAFLYLWPDSIPPFVQPLPDAKQTDFQLPNGGSGRLIRGQHHPRWYERLLPIRQRLSPEHEQMDLLFRLQRYGLEAPRVLAAGERVLADGSFDAFLFTRINSRAHPLDEWLAQARPSREQVLRLAGVFLAQLHQAGCCFRRALSGLAVLDDEEGSARVVLTSAAGVVVRRRFQFFWQRRDLWRLQRLVSRTGLSAGRSVVEGYWEARS